MDNFDNSSVSTSILYLSLSKLSSTINVSYHVLYVILSVPSTLQVTEHFREKKTQEPICAGPGGNDGTFHRECTLAQ